jgi:hypothetical protein
VQRRETFFDAIGQHAGSPCGHMDLPGIRISYLISFLGQGTFEAWSHSGNIHPRYSSQYKGTWKNREGHTYITEGQHIGYDEVTALAIWRDLELVYDPAGDTFSITVYPGQVFSRLSHDPDTQAGTNRSIPYE